MLLPLHHQGSPLKKWRDNYSLRLEESIGKTGFDINHSKFPLDPALRIKKNRNKKNSARDLINLKSTYTARERQPSEWKKSLQGNISTSNSSAKQANGACSSKHTHTLTHTHTHTHQKWAKDLNGYFFKECIQIAIVQFSSVTQSCPTLCDPIDGSTPGSAVPGILQAILEWVAISFSNALK